MSYGPPAPALWFRLDKAARELAKLSTDQCVVGEHCFVLGRIVIPVVDHDEPFVWLAWVSVSAANFARMSELWDTQGRESEPPYFGWLQSELPYEPSTLNLKTMVHTMPVGQRPYILLEPTDHPLALAQRQGLTLAQAQQLAASLLHS